MPIAGALALVATVEIPALAEMAAVVVHLAESLFTRLAQTHLHTWWVTEEITALRVAVMAEMVATRLSTVGECSAMEVVATALVATQPGIQLLSLVVMADPVTAIPVPLPEETPEILLPLAIMELRLPALPGQHHQPHKLIAGPAVVGERMGETGLMAVRPALVVVARVKALTLPDH